MAKKSNTSRTLEYIRAQGWDADRVERFNPYAGKFGIRQDMFGFGDIVAMGEGSIFAIQSCGQAFAAHHRKITQDEKVAPLALKWVQSGGRLLLIGWRKVKLKRGGKAMRWQPRIKEYQISDFIDMESTGNQGKDDYELHANRRGIATFDGENEIVREMSLLESATTDRTENGYMSKQ